VEQEPSKIFPWQCGVCAQKDFIDKTGRYKTEGKASFDGSTQVFFWVYHSSIDY
jgi:hypothetical protein